MRILVDTLSIPPTAAGIRVYVQQLLHRVQHDVELHLVCTRTNAGLFEELDVASRTILPLAHRGRMWRAAVQQALVPLVVRRVRPSLLFAPLDVAPLLAPGPIVTCVHSSHINVHFGYARGFHAWYINTFMRLTLRRSERVIAISQYVKDMTVELLDGDASRIEVIHHGGGLMETMGYRAGLPDTERTGGILFLSTLHAHKRVDRLLEAYARLRQRMPGAPPLVIAGKDSGGQLERLRSIASGLGVAEHVSFLGRVPDEQVVQLLRDSWLMVYSSESEGFGLPVLEAMGAGLPVVASNRSSIPEVVGDAGVLVDPDDVPAMAEAIHRVLTDAGLRRQLIEAGMRRARDFTWARTAGETLELWEGIAAGNGAARVTR